MFHAYREGIQNVYERKHKEEIQLKKRISRLQQHKERLTDVLEATRKERSTHATHAPTAKIRAVLTRVDEQLGLQEKLLKGVDGEAMLHKYLLDSVPYLLEYENAAIAEHATRENMELCESITMEFQEKMNMRPPSEERFQRYKRRRITIDPYICTNCKSRNLMQDDSGAQMICRDCSVQMSFGIPDGIAGLTYEQKSDLPGPQYTYKPEQHFIDLLNQVEAISTRNIPPELISCLKAKFEQFGMRSENITPADVRSMLKDVRLITANGTTQGCKYYEDVFFLTRRLNKSFVPIKIPEERKTIFKAMFREVYARFHCNAKKINPKRKNFLSYPFTAYKFSEHNGWREYMPLFTLLKSREKLRTQDMILKLIFNELAWSWRDTV